MQQFAFVIFWIFVFTVGQEARTQEAISPKLESLWSGARKGNLEQVKKAIESGVPVDAKTDYGATSLSFAADRGHTEIVHYLISQKADPNVKDSFYGATPMDWASSHGHYEIMKLLVQGGATQISPAFEKSIVEKDLDFVKYLANNSFINYRAAKSKLQLAHRLEFPEGVDILERLVKKLEPAFVVPEADALKYSGSFRRDANTRIKIARQGRFLTAGIGNGNPSELEVIDAQKFKGPDYEIRFEVKDNRVTGIHWLANGQNQFLKKMTPQELEALTPKTVVSPEPTESALKFADSSPQSRKQDLALSSANWPQFRGTGARGIADGQNPPLNWNFKEKQNVAWSTPVPGLGHSCPVIWGNHVFVTTAISQSDTGIKTGLYGDVASVNDHSEHEFVTFCFNKENGQMVWRKTAGKAIPKVKRHLKSTHANSTVATNGQFVVAWFASEGVFCYTMEGKLAWKKDLGLLDSGWFYNREYQWQFGASPIIAEDKLILLCDIQDQSFIACYTLKTGELIWRSDRDEIPSWSTPTVVKTPSGKVIVTNATKAARGYDLQSGKELWRIEKNSEIAVPTPFAARNLIFVSSGYRPVQPIYAIRLDARGDLTLAPDTKQSEYIAWSENRGGPYMPSPIVYGDFLYTCANSGIVTCYQATTGKQVYKKRLRIKGIRSFTGSPIAADGHLFFTSEDGETAVVKAGPHFELVANNSCGETCLTTAAISDGKFILRSEKRLIAFETQ